jgi:hypothetical protein
MTLENRNITSHAYLANQISQPNTNLATQNLVTILRHPYQMILYVIHRMRASPVLRHGLALLGKIEIRNFIFYPGEQAKAKLPAKAFRLKGEGLRPGESKSELVN